MRFAGTPSATQTPCLFVNSLIGPAGTLSARVGSVSPPVYLTEIVQGENRRRIDKHTSINTARLLSFTVICVCRAMISPRCFHRLNAGRWPYTSASTYPVLASIVICSSGEVFKVLVSLFLFFGLAVLVTLLVVVEVLLFFTRA